MWKHGSTVNPVLPEARREASSEPPLCTFVVYTAVGSSSLSARFGQNDGRARFVCPEEVFLTEFDRHQVNGTRGGQKRNGVPPVIVCGSTASGKTALAHQLADAALATGLAVTIVNMDAFQFYRGFDIGTAKPDQLERDRYGYLFVDHLEPEETSDAQAFALEARAEIERRTRAGAAVIAVGGSGLYLRSLLHGLDPLPGRNDALRGFIRETARVQGREAVYRWLQALDPVRASELHINDLVRVERALEIALETGERPSEIRSRQARPGDQARLLPAQVVCLLPDPEHLRRRIEERTAQLFAGGWLDETAQLLDRYGARFFDLPASRAIGYREIAQAWAAGEIKRSGTGETAYPEGLVQKVATLTWQYARRQQVWNAQALVDERILSEAERIAFVERYVARLPGV